MGSKEKKMAYKKITVGFVIQDFDDNGNCVAQEFVAGDQVDYEDEEGNPVDVDVSKEYHPYDMVQPPQWDEACGRPNLEEDDA